ncbi:YqgE/AlgH family protein [Niabella soli]|uniref:Transcriptional regulator n=1 Tax=Niabella soli DSM 19437 TaxID=929713 RepID=W0EVA0_9BACT|nr:YqgE/AlgH family protein [Niabella soli]AHF14715.1 transcriptional regulator [Niabella soli DSM 19437]
MNITTGVILKASLLMDDDNFKQAIVVLTEYNEKGAMGFIVSQRFPRQLNELVEFRHSPAFPLFNGGPVDQEHLYFIHRRPDLIDEGQLIGNDIYLGGNFKQAVAAINNGRLTEKDVKIFVGYCGWDFGELETEVAEGYWEFPEEPIDLFTGPRI